MSSEFAIEVNGLGKCYQIYDKPSDRLMQMLFRGRKRYYKEFWALKDVSFNVKKGETFGIIGRNGSGKSTLLQMICGTLNPTSGELLTNGSVAALLELGSGFNPEFTGRENVYMNSAVIGLSRKRTEELFNDIVDFADLWEFIDQPVKTYSSGMFVRLAFAVNIMSDPEIMIVDEALAVGDMAFQAKCITALKKIQENGTTILFVSHDIDMVKSLCSRGLFLERGRVNFLGSAESAATIYLKSMHSEMNETYSNEVIERSDDFQGAMFSSQELEAFDKKVSLFRYGSGEARISFVQLLDDKNNPVEVVSYNELVKIKIHFECHDNEDIAVFFGIMDDKKNMITGAAQIELGNDLIKGKKGLAFEVTYTLRLPLHEGNYSILAQLSRPIIIDQTAKFIDVVHDAVVFNIQKRDPAKLWVKVSLPTEVTVTEKVLGSINHR